MPTVLRRSGPDILTTSHGKTARKTPRAMIHTCETCGYEGAAFLIHTGGQWFSYCGWQNGNPVCVDKAHAKSKAA